MTTPRLVLCTAPEADALPLARALVEGRLAACVNVIPSLTSVYLWKGETCEDGESLLLIKTTDETIDVLTERIVELHPYEVPEVISLPVSSSEGHSAYLKWLIDSIEPRTSKED